MFDPWVRKIPRRRAWQPTSVVLPGESHGQRSLAGSVVHVVAKSQTGLKRLNTEACIHTHTHIYVIDLSLPILYKVKTKLNNVKQLNINSWFIKHL